jgi:hypothetical protein
MGRISVNEAMPVAIPPLEFMATNVPRILVEARVAFMTSQPKASEMLEAKGSGASKGTSAKPSLATQ